MIAMFGGAKIFIGVVMVLWRERGRVMKVLIFEEGSVSVVLIRRKDYLRGCRNGWSIDANKQKIKNLNRSPLHFPTFL